MADEQTVLGAIRWHIDAWIEGVDEAGMSAALGVDVSGPLSRLREDLAIAARVRACEPTVGAVSTGTKDFKRGAAFGWNAALAYLLQGDQP